MFLNLRLNNIGEILSGLHDAGFVVDGVEVGERGLLDQQWSVLAATRDAVLVLVSVAARFQRLDKHRSAHSGPYDVVPPRHLKATILPSPSALLRRKRTSAYNRDRDLWCVRKNEFDFVELVPPSPVLC